MRNVISSSQSLNGDNVRFSQYKIMKDCYSPPIINNHWTEPGM